MKKLFLMTTLSFIIYNKAYAVDEYWKLSLYNHVIKDNSELDLNRSIKGIDDLINKADKYDLTSEEIESLRKAQNNQLIVNDINYPYGYENIITELKKHSLEIDFKESLNLGELAESEFKYINVHNQLMNKNSDTNNLIHVLEKVNNVSYSPKLKDVNENIMIIGDRALGCKGCGMTKKEKIVLAINGGIDNAHQNIMRNIPKALTDESKDLFNGMRSSWKASRATFFKVPMKDELVNIKKANQIINSVAIAGDLGDITNELLTFSKLVNKSYQDPSVKNVGSVVSSAQVIIDRLTEIIVSLENQHEQFGNSLDNLESVENIISNLISLKSSLTSYKDLYKNSYNIIIAMPNSDYKNNLLVYTEMAKNMIYKDVWNSTMTILSSSTGLLGGDKIKGIIEAFNEGLNYVIFYTNTDLDRKRLIKNRDFYNEQTKKMQQGILAINHELLIAGQVWDEKLEADKYLKDFIHKTKEKFKNIPTDQFTMHNILSGITNNKTSEVGSSLDNIQMTSSENSETNNSEFIANDNTQLPTAYEQSINKQDLTIAASDWKVTTGDASKHLSIGNNFGSIKAPNGRQIASLNNADVPKTVMERTYTVPNGVRSVNTNLLANFVTNEYPQFVRTEFNDKVMIDVITSSGNSYKINTPFVQELNSAKLTKVAGLPNPMLKDGGQTGFQKVQVEDIPVANGGKVNIRVTSINTADDLYPSAILISDSKVSNK